MSPQVTRHLLSLAFAVLAVPVAGQSHDHREGTSVELGEQRVRVTPRGFRADPITGRVLSVDGERLVLERERSRERIEVRRDEVQKFEVAGRKKHNALRGALIGAGFALAFVTLGSLTCEGGCGLEGDSVAWTYGRVLVPVGAGAGGAIGFVVRTTRWERTTLSRGQSSGSAFLLTMSF